MTIDLDRVAQLHAEDRELLRIKNARYGNTGLRQTGLEGIATRVIDKGNRILNLARNPELDPDDEAIEDTLRDISNYGILGRMLDDQSLRNRPESVYLAGPIDLAPPDMQTGWRTAAKEILGQYRVASFDPNAAWCGGTFTPVSKLAVMAIDYHAVHFCGMMLAYLPYDVPTLGTVREIEFARSHDKRVVVASPWAGTSAFSADLECYDTLWEALCAILEISEEEITEFVTNVFGPDNNLISTNGHEEKAHDSGDSNSRSHPRPVARRRVRVPQD